jgi:hypothetical protein
MVYGFWRGGRYGIGATIWQGDRHSLINSLRLLIRYEKTTDIRQARKVGR